MVKPQLLSGPAHGPYLVLAHGAGSDMDSPMMTALAEALAGHGVAVARFEFAYMAARRQGGKRPPPSPVALLEDEYRTFLAQFGHGVAAIGGSSLGGWVASRIVDSLRQGNAGPALVSLSYPFHQPGRPHRLHIAHLEVLQAPALIVQGEHDRFGTRSEVEVLPLSPQISLHWLADGEHGFKPRKRSGASLAGNIAAAASAIAGFMTRLQSRV